MRKLLANSPLVATLCTALTLSVSGQSFSVRQLANPERLNRNPTISETGIIAWQETDIDTATVDGRNSVIMLHQDNETKTLTDGLSWGHSANTFPHASGNHIVWQSTFPDYEDRTISWQLQEVPLNTNDIPELWANYDPVFGSGSTAILFTNAAGEVKTNLLVSGKGSRDWNFYPGLQSWNPPPEEVGIQHADGTIGTATPDKPDEKRREPSGDNEIVTWSKTNGVIRITEDHRNDLNPSIHESLVTWQKAKGWPFGWEIMVYDGQERYQLTTNYYYDMAPKVKDGQVVWYGWDGNDFEIYLYDHAKKETRQITDNTFDDVSPIVDGGIVVWEAYPAVEADIYLWKEGQEVLKLSQNIEDDLNPRHMEWRSCLGRDSMAMILKFTVMMVKKPSNSRVMTMTTLTRMCMMASSPGWATTRTGIQKFFTGAVRTL